MAESIQTKRCSKCKQIKPVYHFSKRLDRKNGYRSHCKQCQRQNSRQYYHKHQHERREYEQERRPIRRKYERQYREAHKDKLLLSQKRYYSTVKGHLRRAWYNILQRCNNIKNKRFNDYGGRGIKTKFACFEDFYNYVVKELKVDPRGLTIDRIDNDGHYEKGNIRFVTHRENCQNRRPKCQATKFSSN